MENNKMLRYLEGQLSAQDKKDFEALIESNSDLQLELEMLGYLIDNEPEEIPPYELKQKIYQMANIKDETFMDLAIKKVDQLLDVVLGKEYYQDINPVLITRSNDKSLLFSKTMNKFDILCDVSSDEEGQYLMNLAASKNNKEVDNIKFSITKNNEHTIERYTKSNGNTGSFIINPGVYYINITTLKSEVGNIKINLS